MQVWRDFEKARKPILNIYVRNAEAFAIKNM
jgi:hypothetical protein